MSKQDRQGVRTASDLERKYNFGRSFAEVYGLVDEAKKAAEEAEEAAQKIDSKLSPEEIFNLLTDYGKSEAIYRENGEIYINASFIKTGFISSDLIKAGKIRSTDFEATVAEKLYPDSTLYPGVLLYPNNGEEIIRGIEIDFGAGVIRGVFFSEVTDELEDRIEELEKGSGIFGSLKDIGITTFPTTMRDVADAMPANSMIVIDTRRINGASANSTETISDWGNTTNGVATIMRGYSKDRVGMTIVYGSTSASDANFHYGNYAYTNNAVNWNNPETQNATYPGCYSRKVNGVTEWLNPPMVAGTEYRTVERWNGKAVYAKLINIGYVSKGDNTFAHNTAVVTPISFDVTNNGQDWLNGSNLITNLSANRTNIYFNCTSNFGNIQIVMKYTKE